MVNFKYISLPLLVGLIYGRTVLGVCDFVDKTSIPTKKDGETYTCTSSDDGYYYVETDITGHTGYIAKYTYTEGANPVTATKKTDRGFYKLKSGKFASCANDECIVLETPSGSCTNDNIGKLVNDSTNGISLCLAEYEINSGTKKYPTLKFATNTADTFFLVQHKSGTIFNFDVTSNYYVVEQNIETILFKNDYNSNGNIECAKASTSKIISRIEDLCSADDSTGKYFDCTAGKCKSYKQDKSDVQESNGEKCEYDSEKTKYIGNCVENTGASNYYYIIGSDNKILLTAQSGTIIKLDTSDANGYYPKGDDVTLPSNPSYFLNGDVNTKETYPLIRCTSSTSTCSLMAVDAPGYYLNIPDSGSAAGVQCISKSNCKALVDSGGCSSANVGVFYLTDKKFCNDVTGVVFPTNKDVEYLITVDIDKFPGVTTKSNIAVKLDKTNRTIKLVEKNSKCLSDNDIIKKEDGKFYYCTNNVEIEMKDNGAIFVNKDSSSKYQLVKINAIGTEILTTKDQYIENYKGYYVDRSTGGNGIVECSKMDSTEENTLECKLKTVSENDVFVNNEVKFPINKVEHNAKLIHCTGGKCEVMDDNFGKGSFFTNSGKGLIQCSESLNCVAKDPKEVGVDKIKDGNYVNGISLIKKDLSLIKCKSEKYTESGNEKTAVYCVTKQAEKNGYYLEFNGNLIICGEDKCVSKAPADIFEEEDEIKINTYLNSDDSDDKIIECKEEKCEAISKPNNYFVDDNQKALVLIKCDSIAKTCKKESLQRDSESIYRGVFISKDGERLISCEQTSCKIIKDSDKTANKKEDKYYLNGETGTNVKPLIHGNQPVGINRKREDAAVAKWELKEADVDGIYINVNEDGISKKYPVIYCTGKYTCKEIEVEKTDTNTKFMDLNNNAIISGGSSTTILSIGNNLKPTFALIVDKSSSKILEEPSANNKLVVCNFENEKWKCSIATSSLSNYYINPSIGKTPIDKNLLITSSNSISEVIKKANLIDGYYINSSSEVLECSTAEGCSIYTQPDETWCTTPGNAGKIRGNTLCTVPDASNAKTATLTQTTTRYIIGSKMKYVNNKKIVSVTFTEDSYYLINDGSYGKVIATSNQTGKVYKCSSSNECSEVAGAGKTFPNSDVNTKSYSTIYCDKDNNCKYSNTVNTSSNVYCISSTYKLLSCKNNCDNVDECTEIINKVGYYLPYQKNYLIDCSSSSCSEKKSEIVEGYYKSEDLANQLIRCDKSVGEMRCNYATSNDGYYIHSGLNLISCKDNVCTKIPIQKQTHDQWFPSGDSKNLLINCPKSDSISNNCVGYAKPKEGFYYIKKGNYMISCSKNKNDILTCSKYNPPYDGFFITAMEESYLIEYKNNELNDSTMLSIDTSPNPTSKYYRSGETGKLLRCINNECENVSVVNDWYIKNSDGLKVINCNSNKCTVYSTSDLIEGYYLNGADDKSEYPILENYKDIDDGNKLKFRKKDVKDIENGWYISADGSVIQCIKSGNTGFCKKESFTNSCSTNSAKYILKDGIITWCVNENVKLDPEMKKAKKIVVPIKSANTIPWIKEGTGSNKFAIFEIDAANKITQVKIDGHYYDSNSNKLYFCTGWGNGLCEEVSVTGGYYLDYTNHLFYRCNKNDEKLCLTIKFNEEDGSKNVQCNSDNKIYNVVMDGRVVTQINEEGQPQYDDENKKFKFKLCNKDDDIGIEDIGEININYVYAIPNKKFPSASTNYRYILVDISKYKVTFKDYIKEVDECPEVATNNDSDKDVICLKDKSVLVIKKTLSTDSDLQKGSNIQINNKSIKKEIVYDYDTRNGYFIYKYASNKNELSKAYIKINDKSKYECEIGGACITKDVGEEPVLGYELINGILRMKKSSEGTKEVTTKIMDGYYYNSDKQESYYCDNGKCDKNNDSTIQFNNGKISFNGESSTGLYNKYIFNSNDHNKRDIYDGTNYYIMNELSTVRYSKVNNEERTNIFIDGDKKMISNEIPPENVEGYTCENGKCYQIDKSGNEKYFLNSKQTGKKENAIAVCGGGKCKFINANEGLLFENYAATGYNDAIIKCTSEKCETGSINTQGTQGLPNCKKDIGGIVKSDKNKSCVTDKDEELLEKQSCISDGEIYTFEGGDCEKSNVKGIKLFDVTFRELDTTKVNEKHYGASLYDCSILSKCYLTYGYVIGADGYSKCSTIGCEYYDKSTLKGKCEIAGEGALINDGNNIKVCSSDEISSDGYYPVTINLKNTFPEAEFRNKILVNVSDSSKIITMVITDGYLLLSSSNAVIDSNVNGGADGNVLYQCNSVFKRCEVVENPNYGYYRSERYKNIIECTKNTNDETKCIMTDKNNKDSFVVNNSINIGFSDNSSNNYYAVENKFPGYDNIPVIAEASKYSVNVLKTNNYVLINTEEKRLANKNDSLKTLYICNSKIGKCELKYGSTETITDGWYVSGQLEYKAIKCTSGSCQVVDVNNGCKGEGDFIYSNNQYIFCGISKSQIKISEEAGKFSQFLLNNLFPNGKNYAVVYPNYVVGIGYVDKENPKINKGLQQCSNGCKSSSKLILENEYCINNNKIYKYYKIKEEDTNPTCEQQFTTGVRVEIFKGNTLANTIENAKGEGNQMYYCKNGECSIVSGYKNIAGSYILCDYAKCTEASGSKIGQVNGSSIKIADGSNLAIEDGKYYLISGDHKFPGAETFDSFLVEVNSDYVVQFKGEGYYLISNTNEMLITDPKENTESDVNTENNKLYYCNSSKICKLLDSNEIGNGFYINSGVSNDLKYRKSIINCKNGNCIIAGEESILFQSPTSNKCSAEQIGKLVRITNTNGAFQEYKMCIKKGSAPEEIKKTDGSSKFFVITLSKGSSFGSITVTGDDKSLIIEEKKDYVKQYNGEGYILLGSNGEILSSLGNANGSLYECKKSNEDGVKCESISTPNNGWYFNNIFGDKRYIKYDTISKFEIIIAKEAVKCDSTGTLIYNEGFKLCHTLNKVIDIGNDEVDAITNIEVASNFPGINVDKMDILLSVKSNAVYQLKMKTNIVVREDNIVDDKNEGTLYQCEESGECKRNEIPNDNYYLKTDKDKNVVELVYCKYRNCHTINKEYTFNGKYGVNEGFRVGSSRTYPLIQCILPEKKKEGDEGGYEIKGLPICKERELKEGWYLNAENSGKLIKCTKESGCNEVSGEIKSGWYLNAAVNYKTDYKKITDKEISPIIQCTSNSCILYEETIDTSCTAEKVGNVALIGGKYRLCTGGTASIELTSNTIEIINNNSLPEASAGYIAVSISDSRAVVASNGYYLKGTNAMYDCRSGSCSVINSDDKNGVHLYENVKGVLMVGKCANSVCNEWKAVTQEGNYVLNTSEKLVTQKDEQVGTIYECLKVGSAMKCKEMKNVINTKGYYLSKLTINNVVTNVVYSCDDSNCSLLTYKDLPKCTLLYYDTNICYISYLDEPDTETYIDNRNEPIISPGNICVSGNNVYFAFKEINTGIDEPNCLSLSSSSNVENYYYIDGFVYSANKYYSRNLRDYKKLISSVDNTVLIGRTNNDSSIWKEDNNYLVKCNGKICTKDSNEVPLCTYEYSTGKCKSQKSLVTGQLCYSSEGNTYIIVDKSSGACTNYKNSWGYSIEDSNVNGGFEIGLTEEYIDIYVPIDGTMYRINNYNEMYVKDEGVYIIDNANKLVEVVIGKTLDISENSKFKMYICTKAGCNVKNVCGGGLKDEYIYYNNRILKCDAKKSTITYIENANGYYINGPWENVMRCTNGNCEMKDEEDALEGYYLDSGNYENIIKCVRENEKFKCVSEPAVLCNYKYDSSKDITFCKSKDNLSRNSYCLNIIKDINGKITQKPVMLYIENFIKAKDTGVCIENDGKKDIYYHYRKSKFLGRPEKEEIIKLTTDAVVKLYEKDLGYYIISTNTRTGITDNTDLNKSRLYECSKNGCVEIKDPVDQRIYINKASSEKMVRYQKKSKSWEVIKHYCRQNYVNYEQCTLSTVILKNDILYTLSGENIKFKYATNEIKTTNVVLDKSRSTDVEKNTYLYIENSKDGRVYIFDESEQFFEVVSDPGYYIFKNSNYNMIPYRSTVNVTSLNDVRVLYKEDDNISNWKEKSIGNIYNVKNDGYILNKADLKKEGLAIQIMNVPEKYTTEDEGNKRKRDDDDGTKVKMKSVINKCTSIRKNSCQNTREKQKITAGEICVVVEGDYKGLYLAIDDIEKNTSTSKINCIRYDDDNSIYYDNDDYRSTYSFLGNNLMLFAGMTHSKLLAKVNKNFITLFDNNNDGYYIIDNTEKKLITSNNGISATVYKCGNVIDYYTADDNDKGVKKGDPIEGSDRYECNAVAAGTTSKYYYDSKGDNVLFKSGKYNVENKKGYYFYNKDRLSATINKQKKDNVSVDVADTIYYSYSSSNDGHYISSSNLDSSKVIIVNKDNGKREIVMNYNKCVITGNQCKPEKNDVVFSTGDVCYSAGKLYVVEVQEGENSESTKTLCYSGKTTTIKYRLIDDEFYRLDGDSVQIITKGIYVLNSNWEEYSTTYPEIAPIIIDCDNSDCAKVEGLDIEQDVIINAAGTGVNKIMKYYSETNKFINIDKEGYYFFNSDGYIDESSSFTNNAYYLTNNGELKLVRVCKNDKKNYCLYDTNYENGVKTDYKLRNIYLNKVKEGSFIRYGSMYIDEMISYDKSKEKVIYNGVSGTEIGENAYVFINGEIYNVHSQYLEAVGEGLYVLEGSSPFVNIKWTEISSEGLCYYTGSSCDSNMLNEFKEQKYSINSATKKTSIVEYDSDNQKWRMVNNDGIYFFFEDGYSITESNRRISKVYEIVDGEVIDITESENRIGYYKYNELMVESNNIDGWEDAIKIIDNVDVNDRRMCSTYELNEKIDDTKLCYDAELGLCIPKSELSNDTIDSINCIFSYDQTEYYFLVGEKLYSISGQAFKNIKKNGIYIVGKNNKVYGSSLENKANAYKCENGVCKLEENFTTGYYLNMADEAQESPIILYYNDESKTWRTTTVEGNYFFNGMGEAAGNGDDIKYAYRVENSGKVVESIIDQDVKGIYINQSNGNGNVIVEYKNKWQKAKEIPECAIGEDGRTVTSEAILRTGDICVDVKSLVFITRGVAVTERKRESTNEPDNEGQPEEEEEEIEPVIEEGTIIGISTVEDKIKYGYDANEKAIIKMESGNIYQLSLNGYVVIGKTDSIAVESEKPMSANVYKCSKGICSEASPNANDLVVNVIAEKYPLLKVNEKGKWSVVTEAGYYFFGTNYDVLAENGIVGSAFEVEVNDNGKIIQSDITDSKKLGIYINKAVDTQMVVSNDEYFWSRGAAAKKCVLTVLNNDKGKACRTTDVKITLQAGDYCIANNEFFVLTDEVTSSSENENCVSSKGKTKYLTSEVISTIKGKSTSDRLLKLSNDGVSVANEGYYYLNDEGEEVEQDNGKEITMYNCGKEKCDVVNVEPNALYLTEKGEIFTTVETNLTKIAEPGLYFFNENNIGCKLETDVVHKIIEVTENGNEVINLDELKEGAYINSVNGNSIGVHKGDAWSIEVSDCKVENDICTSDSETLEVGSYCINNSTIYFVNEVNVVEDVTINKCVKGDDENPFYVRNEDGEILVIKESSINVIEEDGYYALDKKNNVALSSSNMVESIFMKCEASGDCVDIVPEKMSNYLNRAPISKNIVHFIINNAMNATTIDTQCTVEGNTCTVEEGELESGDLCVANDAIYLIKDDKQCVSTEKYVERYQFVNNKIYKLGIDVVVQEFDGYYFMNGDNRAIGSVEDYAKSDTVGYMCSVSGECFLIQPGEVRYYKDYASIENEKFTVVKFDPERVSKRDEEGNSGYSVIENEGIYKLDDGSYVDCAFETNGEVACTEIKNVGSRITIDNEIIQCIKNEKKEVECTQATAGGYYMVDGILKECEANEDADQLICKDVEKEGYFIAYNKEELYECVETVDEEEEEEDDDGEIEISNIDISLLNGLLGNVNNEPVIAGEDGSTEPNNEDEPVGGNNTEEIPKEQQSGAVEEPKPVEEPLVPVNVTCKSVECIESNVLPVGAETGTELYVCVKVQKAEEEKEAEAITNADEGEEIEEDKFRWVAKEDCESGSYLKKNNNFYKCEEEKENLDEEKIEKPNNDHTSTEGSTKTSTKKTTVSSTTEDTTTTEVTTTKVTTTNAADTTTTTSKKISTTDKKTSEVKTTTSKTTTTKTTTSTSTTAPKPTNNENGSGALVSRSIPSVSLYLTLFLFALFVHF